LIAIQAAPLVDVPFDKRHLCWFCEEPCDRLFEYPSYSHTPHPSLSVPACRECLRLANRHRLGSIWDCRVAVKDELTRLYAKHLAIGVNWTEQELAESEFSCKVFEGFKKSAWMMFKIARDRVNARGWPLSLAGQPLDDEGMNDGFEFDGVRFGSVSAAIAHYGDNFYLDKQLLTELISLVGRARFGYAVRLCRIHIGTTAQLKRQLLQDVAAELAARRD
jgi:hypothetical protein